MSRARKNARGVAVVALAGAVVALGVPGVPARAAQEAGAARAAGAASAADGARVTVIRGGTVHTLAGPPIEGGVVVIRGERIEAVGRDVPVPAGARVIDATGLQVYPGLFDAVSRLGLTEIGSVPATLDIEELGDENPHLVAATAIHPASEHIPVARANGITHAVAAPGGGLWSGQATAVHLSGWTVEEMMIEPSVALVLEWPTMQTRRFDPSTFEVRERPFAEAKKEYEEKVARLDDWIEAARQYAHARAAAPDRVRRDLKLEAVARAVRGERPLLVRADDERDIRNAVEWAKKHGLRMILAGGAEAYRVKDLLRENGVPVILGPTQRLPRDEDEPYDAPFTAPGELHAAGVKIAFATFDASDSRTLPYEAANAVPFGLPWEEALKAITLYPAQILGLDDRLGTIEPGKIANLIVTDGDPLAIPTQVRYLLIRGEPTSTENRHLRLYEQYRVRPPAAARDRSSKSP
jgi:imidazolonepropionase-like amidohydrolase